eukprot:729294_1
MKSDGNDPSELPNSATKASPDTPKTPATSLSVVNGLMTAFEVMQSSVHGGLSQVDVARMVDQMGGDGKTGATGRFVEILRKSPRSFLTKEQWINIWSEQYSKMSEIAFYISFKILVEYAVKVVSLFVFAPI